MLMKKQHSIDITEINAQLGPAKQAPKRVRDLRLLRELECPHCRIESLTRSLLVPIQRASGGGFLRCYFCGGDFPVPDRE
jgi:transcription elongation factor Elf1